MSKEKETVALLSASRYACYGTCKPLPEQAFPLALLGLASHEYDKLQSFVQETKLYKNEEAVFNRFILSVQEHSGYSVQSEQLADLLKTKFPSRIDREELIAKIDQILPARRSYQLSN